MENHHKNNKMLEYNMKITPGTLLGTLFALWTSKNDPKEAKWTPNGSPRSPNGAQRLPKGPKWSPKGAQRAPREPKESPNGAQKGAKRGPKMPPGTPKTPEKTENVFLLKTSIFERR